jgi:pyruvate kinase
MRINFSHATYDEANLRMTNLKKSKGLNIQGRNMRAVMLDTQGPEIRSGTFVEGMKGLDMKTGDIVSIEPFYNKAY